MFLRRNQRKKDGKVHTYWDLVESVRTVKGPRNRRVAYLGELTPSQRDGWGQLQIRLKDPAMQALQQASLFPSSCEKNSVPETVEIRLSGVSTEKVRSLGDVWLALSAWRSMKLDRLLLDLIPEGKEKIAWAHVISILVLGRICSPGSERHTAEVWYPQTALVDLLGLEPETIYTQRLYRALDALLPRKEALERHLKHRFGELFGAEYELILYDITSTYFEGKAEGNEKARRGHSRDKRFDCKQVCLGLLTSTDGLPFGYEVFSGERHDSTTVEEIVEAMEKRHGKANRIWVMDRGMVSEENLAFLNERSARYLIGTPKSMLRKFEKELLQKDWEEVQEGLEVRLCNRPDSEEVFVLCRSRERREKEKAMHERFENRIEKALHRLTHRLKKRKKKEDAGRVQRQIGRLLGRNSRSAGLFDIRVTEDKRCTCGIRLTWEKRETWKKWSQLSEGCYLLRTNIKNRSATKLWRTYMHLTDVEDSFRTIKSCLNLRPIWHQNQNRVEAHILVAFLGYAVWKTLQKWSERAGLGSSVKTLLESMRTIQATDVILQTTANREIRIPSISTPGKETQILLQRLGLNLPRRLSSPKWIKMT